MVKLTNKQTHLIQLLRDGATIYTRRRYNRSGQLTHISYFVRINDHQSGGDIRSIHRAIIDGLLLKGVLRSERGSLILQHTYDNALVSTVVAG